MATTKTKSNTNEQKRKDTIFDKNIENQNIYTTTQNIDINIPIIGEKKKKVQINVNNKNKIALVTDSSNSITPADAKKLDITILNFSVTRTKGPEIEVFEDQTNDKTLSEIFINIDNGYKYNTSTIPLGIVEDELKRLFEKNEYVLFLPVSKGLSNQFEQLEALTKVFPNLIILNSESSAYINEYIILQVHELIQKSKNVDSIDIIEQVKNLVNDIKLRSVTFFGIKDISGSDGGRIPKSFIKILKLAKVSPIVELDFKNKSAGFTTNWEEISKKIIELINKKFDGLLLENIVDIAVVHAQAERKYIDFLLTALVNYFHIEPNKIKIKLTPSSISIHTRKNALGIAIITNKYKNNI